MDYSIHCEIGNKYGVEYRSINKAPEAKQGTNDDKDVVLDLDVKNIPAVPTALWMSSLRQIPAFRINVLAGIGSGHTGEVSRGVPLVDVLRGADPLADAQVVYMVRTWTDKILRDYDRGFVKAPDDSLARLIYYAQRFALFYNRTDDNSALEVGEDRNHMALNSDIFLVALRDMLKFHHITSDFVALPSRYGPPIDDVMGPGDMVVLLRVNTTKPFYINCNNMFTCPGPIPAYLEGQPCIELSSKNLRKNASVDMTMKMPYSRPEDNLHQENLQIDMNDKQLLHIRRQTTLTGAMKEDEQLHLLNFEDCYEAERNALRVDRSIMDDLKKARKSRNISEDYATAVQKARASLKDRFKDEISSEFTEDPREMIKWSVDKPGLRDYDPNLVYSTEFTMDGLVQRAGNNYIVSIGKTVNSPLKLSPSQRTRKVDVVMPYARVLDCSVSFAIPQGFTVQGIDKLNRKVENECGSLVATAQVQGNQLVVHFKRVYRHNAESVAKWPDLLAIIDATAEFAEQKVLLKKG